ncbi:MAG TPA: heat-inducible transcription repressor HrcA [Acholeplasma sp.]|nr:heat-inducible transcription repressor HrcA [Acholeplasma sp.]
MLTSRQKLILKAIVEYYVEYAQPVGSKILTKMPYLDYSSATIRYDMARLEELGYLEKTHTSSGRIPSERGYRYYVNHLVTRDSDVADDFPLVDEVITRHSYSRNLAVEEAINLLSELTKYTAMAVGPKNSEIKITKIDLIPTSEREAVILIVTNKGHVQHQNIAIPEGVKVNDITEVIKTLDDLLKNRYLEEAEQILKSRFAKEQISSFVEYQRQIYDSFIHAFAKFAEDKFYLSGITNVFDQPEFSNVDNIKNFVDMLDRREIVKFIGGKDSLNVTFGSEIELKLMENFSIISVPYRVSETEKGTIAVVGPTRMEYSKVIPLLEYIASNLGKLYRK